MSELISTQRLILRRWIKSDVAPFSQMNADSKVMQFFPSVMSPKQSTEFIERIESQFEERGFGLWVVEIGGKFAGFTGLNVTKFDTPIGPHVEIGWRLARWAWGKGYATEAAQAAMRSGFEDHGLPEIFSFTSQTNLRSEAVMKRLGMHRRVDLDFDHPKTPGWWGQPHIVYQLTAAEWKLYFLTEISLA